MARVQFARLREQDITFGVVVVKDHVIDLQQDANDAVSYWSRQLGCPTVLLGARRHTYYGRTDIVRFLKNISLDRIPWREANI